MLNTCGSSLAAGASCSIWGVLRSEFQRSQDRHIDPSGQRHGQPADGGAEWYRAGLFVLLDLIHANDHSRRNGKLHD
jgi:hypothetical protein